MHLCRISDAEYSQLVSSFEDVFHRAHINLHILLGSIENELVETFVVDKSREHVHQLLHDLTLAVYVLNFETVYTLYHLTVE